MLEPPVLEPIPDLPLEFPAAVLARSHSHRTRRSSRKPLKTALAAAAVLTLAVVPAVWEHQRHAPTATEPAASSTVSAPVVQSTPARDASGNRTSPRPARQRRSHRPSTTFWRRRHGKCSRTGRCRRRTRARCRESRRNRRGSCRHSRIPGRRCSFRTRRGPGVRSSPATADQPGAILKITRIVDDNAQNFHARPSPDGSRIAFDSDREGTRAVFVADADGQHVRRMSGDGFAALPSWSPSGKQLAFVKAEADKPRVWNLWTADLGNGELRRITSYAVRAAVGRIVVSRRSTPGLRSREPTCRDRRGDRCAPDICRSRPGRLIRSPAVSPDGRRVIFQVTRDGVWLFDVRNRSMRRVLDDPTAEEHSWSPDGHRVAFHSRRTGGWGVWVMGQ